MKRIYIVTGALGHVGRTVVQKLLDRGETVRGLALAGEKNIAPDNRMTLIEGDVCRPETLEPLFAVQEPSELVVIHTAGIVSIASRYMQKVYDVNVNGTRNVIELCLKHKVSRLVHVSSVHAIPELPDSGTITEIKDFDPGKVHGLYAKTKAEATALVLASVKRGLNAVVVHPSGILGPGDYGHGHLTQLVQDYLNGRLTACVKGGYDFVDVRDVADGIISAVEKGRTGECYLLTNRFVTVHEMLDILHELTGRHKIRTVLPLWFAKLTAPLSEIYYKIRKQPPLYTSYSLYTLESNANFSHAKADAELGYTPRPLRKTLKDTVDFLCSQGRTKIKSR